VDYTFGVCELKCACEIAEDRNDLALGQRAHLSHSCAERFAFDVWHRVVRHAIGDSSGKNWNDVRMLEGCCESHFAGESVGAQTFNDIASKKFYDDVATEGSLVREEDARHSTTAELSLDGIGATKRGLQAVAEIHPSSS
jgi:hypothetical protein